MTIITIHIAVAICIIKKINKAELQIQNFAIPLWVLNQKTLIVFYGL